MPSDKTHTNETKPQGIAGTILARMPAGGWLRDTALHENWRTTTIVQRHRDRAAPGPHL
nr:hypothetical protein [uncultured Methanoregula sp.]